MSEKKLEVFNVLNFLNSGYELKDILKEGNFGTFSSSDECLEYIVAEGYLEKDESRNDEEITFESISEKYTVSQLKEILKDHNLKVSGKKEELVERVLPVLKNNNNLDGYIESEKSYDDFKLTDKGYEFLEENSWIDLYMFALVMFRFEDYETYWQSSDMGSVETAFKFCDQIISKALVANQFLVFLDALSAKAHVYAYINDYESFLDYDLQHFIMALNPMVMDSQIYAKYNPINFVNIINLRNVVEKLDMGSLKKRFNKIWNKSHIKHTTVPKKTCYKILVKAIDGADVDELNSEIREKFFDRKYAVQ